jgi:hypothetical protein
LANKPIEFSDRPDGYRGWRGPLMPFEESLRAILQGVQLVSEWMLARAHCRIP